MNLYLSTDSIVDANDTLLGTITVNNSSANTQTLNVTVPSSLVPQTDSLPKYFYYKLLGENATTPATTKITIFPYKSKVVSSLVGASSLTTYTMDADTEKFFIEYYLLSSTTKLTISVFAVQNTLDVNMGLVRDQTTTYSQVGSTENAAGLGQYEFSAYNLSLGTGLTVYQRVGKVSGTGTFKAAAMSNSSLPIHSFRPSCTGGAGFYASRCVDYLDGDPGSNAVCISLQGSGSTYSSFPCSSANRIARCYLNPLLQDSRAVMSFYNPSDTTSTASSTCGSDILKTP